MPKSTATDIEALAAALSRSGWEFRTAEGIAEDLGVAADEVAQALARHPELARRSPMTDRRGRELYAPANRPMTLRERLEQVRWVLAH